LLVLWLTLPVQSEALTSSTLQFPPQPCGSIGVPDPHASIMPASISISPDGTVCAEFVIRDVNQAPLCGVPVTMDLLGTDISFCGTQPEARP
jgi:hypothetical protein